ncbi:MAG: adenylyltransferase/cytidyltransferase family protein [Candidatus Thorarchaeota archaeon]
MKNKIKTVAVSGYFDPVHRGHIEYFKLAKELAGEDGKVVCILNNDYQALLKKPKVFMLMEERRVILEAIKYIDEVYISIDNDESVCKSLQVIDPDIFAKGGDRYSFEIPEEKICEELKIEIVDGLGEKVQASSELIKKWETKGCQ